ncbi:MAG: DUF169 domain-containing protein [Acidobacteria bacterium]|nr:DUF169 domain-containing protein [Acidobacteriota bacterium]
MQPGLKKKFTERWRKYFPGADLPIAFYYADDAGRTPVHRIQAAGEGHHCFIDDLAAVRQGNPLAFDAKSLGCFGGKRYLGFTRDLMPDFEYFLSCGIPGRLDGERYKKTPELVKRLFNSAPVFTAPGKYVVFKRWDLLADEEEPQVVIFFSSPDVLSGLFTLANYDEPTNEAVYCPMGAGCATIVQIPMAELGSGRPRAVLGMFDVSARPGVPADRLTFSVPIRKFERMVADMDESFLITGSWERIRERLTQ